MTYQPEHDKERRVQETDGDEPKEEYKRGKKTNSDTLVHFGSQEKFNTLVMIECVNV